MRRDLNFKTASIAGASDLTILAPIKKGLVPALDAVTYKTRVKRVLRLLHTGRTLAHEYEIGRVLSDAVERVGKIHSIRIAVLEPEDKILLAVTFDGAWESYIRVIWQKVSRLLDLIFCNTEGYKLGWESTFDEWCVWLRSAQAETPFLYSAPNLTNTDGIYLRSIERIHRRGRDLNETDRQIAQFNAKSAEENAYALWTSGTDLNNRPYGQKVPDVVGGPAFRQGLKTLVGLYRLSEVYVQTVGDGAILHRATQELLVEFRKMVASPDFEIAKFFANKHYADAVHWFTEVPIDYERTAPQLPPEQTMPVETEDIQGGILEAYPEASNGCLLLIAFPSVGGMVKFLKKFSPTTMKGQETLAQGGIAQNIAITLEGLRRAGLSDDEIAEMPEEFIQGMDKRQGVLGDLYVNHPRRWRLPVQNWDVDGKDMPMAQDKPRIQLSSVHAVVQLRWCGSNGASDVKQELLDKLKTLLDFDAQTKVYKSGAIPLSLQWMHRLKDAGGKPIEHFGFGEADSNPVYQAAGGKPKFNNQVHIGEVLNGYPNAADHAVPANGAKSERAKFILKNGSFLVVRKLRQHVDVLDEVIDRSIKAEPTLNRQLILAKMMGRWPVGAKDDEGKDQSGQPLVGEAVAVGSNDFNFDDDADGVKCPFQAHIRRTNPRDEIQDAAAIGKRPPRIARRGMSYGQLHVPNVAEPEKDAQSLANERGLVFMAYNASIGEQFEVIQRWISGGNSTGSFSGQSDPFLGVAEPGRPRVFQFMNANSVSRVELDGSDEFHVGAPPLVQLEWGMYLFTPSLNTLDYLSKRAQQQSQSPNLEWSPERGELLIKDLQALESVDGHEKGRLAWKEVLEDPDSASDFKAASVWSAIRKKYGGVLKTPFGVLVASQELADKVLLDTAGNLTAHGYLPRMRNSFGELYLGMDAGRTDLLYERESSVANKTVLDMGGYSNETQSSAVGVVHNLIDNFIKDAQEGASTAGENQWQTAIDVRDLIEEVIAHFCESWFGLSPQGGHFAKGGMNWSHLVDGEVPRYPGHFMAPSRFVFQPHPSETVRDVASVHGKALNKAMTAYLTEHGATLKNTHPLVESILDGGVELGDEGYAPRTLLGLMMGFVPTTDGLMRRIAFEWMRDGTLWSLRTLLNGAARGKWENAEFAEAFHGAFEQTFLLRAAPELLWRTAKWDHDIGSGNNLVTVKTGDVIVVGQISATHEGLENQGSQQYENSMVYAFGDSRKQPNSLKPTHACPGKNAALAVMKGFLKGLITYPVPMRPGPGSLSFVVESELSQHAQILGGKNADEQNYQTEIYSPDEDQLPQLFALGDSWLWQNEVKKKFVGFSNLVSSLKEFGYAFGTSANKYPPPADGFSDNGFNRTGFKLAELPLLHDLLKTRFQKVTEKNAVVGAILLSGSGNDIAAHDKKATKPDYRSAKLYKLLREKANTQAEVFDQNAKNDFFGDLKKYYTHTLKILLNTSQAPILIHGYDYPIPDGRPFLNKNGVEIGIGPWLQGVFDEKKIDRAFHRIAMRDLIVELNTLISNLVEDKDKVFSDPERARLHYVKMEGVLHKQPDFGDPEKDVAYQTYWANEIHPTKLGFDILACEIVKKLNAIGVANAPIGSASVKALCPYK